MAEHNIIFIKIKFEIYYILNLSKSDHIIISNGLSRLQEAHSSPTHLGTP